MDSLDDAVDFVLGYPTSGAGLQLFWSNTGTSLGMMTAVAFVLLVLAACTYVILPEERWPAERAVLLSAALLLSGTGCIVSACMAGWYAADARAALASSTECVIVRDEKEDLRDKVARARGKCAGSA